MIKEDWKRVLKKWGEELWLVNNDKYCGKLLMLKKGAESSYHCHKIKQETFYCLEGAAKLKVEGEDYDLVSSARPKTILPGEFHSFKGYAPTVILEISTHHDDSDVERQTESTA